MAGAELAGIGSLEEMLLGNTQNATPDVEGKCDSPSGIMIMEQDDATSSDFQSDNSETVAVYSIDMDISETMGTLKSRAAEALHLDLQDYTVFVLSEKELGDEHTLQKQCGTESGFVQIQFAVKHVDDGCSGIIDILDVLKPNEAEPTVTTPKPQIVRNPEPKPNSTIVKKTKVSKTMRWIVCPVFKELQRLLKIPQDPYKWSVSHVKHWLSWAIYQFGLRDVNISNSWNMTGKELFALGQMEFQKLVPDDPADIFYMHFELLRRTKVVAVVCDPNSTVPKPAPPKNIATISFVKSESAQGKNAGGRSSRDTSGGVEYHSNSYSGNGSGTQTIHLWQFLLELLTTPKLYPVISWYGSDGEFRLHQPEVVASLWGQRKSKPNMNYEKLSRALRYYYEGDMLAKVYGRRFVYRFVLDLKSVIGYSAEELKQQVEDCRTREGYWPDISQSMVII